MGRDAHTTYHSGYNAPMGVMGLVVRVITAEDVRDFFFTNHNITPYYLIFNLISHSYKHHYKYLY